MAASAWLACVRPRPGARVRLVCFPHAGGGTLAFHAWPTHLPPEIEVHAVALPGRERRLREAPATDLRQLVRDLAPAVAVLADRPLALWGHSLGALLAFEVARSWQAHGGPAPRHVFVSGCRAPHVPASEPPLHALPEDAFVAGIQAMGGTPPAVWQHADLRQLVLPALRADFTLAETYRYAPGPPLDCSLSAFGGDADPRAAPHDLQAWSQHTRRDFEWRLFRGGHFFLQSCPDLVLGAVAARLTSP
jgi:medium-chain acyl-[acyl-carrier-protein] hydrolase